MVYVIDVGFVFSGSAAEVLEKSANVRENVGVEEVSSGFGFGVRDMQFEFEKESDRDGAMLRLKESGLKFEYLSSYEEV